MKARMGRQRLRTRITSHLTWALLGGVGAIGAGTSALAQAPRTREIPAPVGVIMGYSAKPTALQIRRGGRTMPVARAFASLYERDTIVGIGDSAFVTVSIHASGLEFTACTVLTSRCDARLPYVVERGGPSVARRSAPSLAARVLASPQGSPALRATTGVTHRAGNGLLSFLMLAGTDTSRVPASQRTLWFPMSGVTDGASATFVSLPTKRPIAVCAPTARFGLPMIRCLREAGAPSGLAELVVTDLTGERVRRTLRIIDVPTSSGAAEQPVDQLQAALMLAESADPAARLEAFSVLVSINSAHESVRNVAVQFALRPVATSVWLRALR